MGRQTARCWFFNNRKSSYTLVVKSIYSVLLSSTLRFLGPRPRSRHEIVVFLKKKTSDQDLIAKIIAELTQKKFIDDVKFSQWLIASRSRSRPRGRRLLELELRQKGIDPAPDDLSIDELPLAQAALLKKHKAWARLSAKDYRPKATRFLASRGFSWATIEKALKTEYNN